jgi:hypothetical protein
LVIKQGVKGQDAECVGSSEEIGWERGFMLIDMGTFMTRKMWIVKKEVKMNGHDHNQRPGRQVVVDEDLLRRLIEAAQIRERQPLVPAESGQANNVLHNEYRILDGDSINQNELSRYLGDSYEIDLNRNRNDIPQITFG